MLTSTAPRGGGLAVSSYTSPALSDPQSLLKGRRVKILASSAQATGVSVHAGVSMQPNGSQRRWPLPRVHRTCPCGYGVPGYVDGGSQARTLNGLTAMLKVNPSFPGPAVSVAASAGNTCGDFGHGRLAEDESEAYTD